MRSVAKTGTYSLMHFTVAIIVAYAVTGSWQAALAISLIEPLVQTVAYVIHERVWERVWPARFASQPDTPPVDHRHFGPIAIPNER